MPFLTDLMPNEWTLILGSSIPKLDAQRDLPEDSLKYSCSLHCPWRASGVGKGAVTQQWPPVIHTLREK